MSISLRLAAEDETLFKDYAKFNNMSVSELIRTSVMDRIEDEHDLQAYEASMAAHRENPITYSHAEVRAMLDQP